ncbi:nitrate reductase delta subunit [Oikeobacillus pervagus]|uniref:Nitrate reductase delta subunit n=1 Tax=Oikeobacillus pervagus TaxID=1325931 RepID=A0AAJ1T6G3_9BACI|nr:nitrate reductase molybdenum cofactor assembly chaperone [Oikeobacillus pervagus]MDQ0215495.1 nitrate reductase delta subunit [Oikeobacillus pervagus]
MNQRQKVFSLVSKFLQYPDEEWRNLGEIEREIEQWKSLKIRQPLLNFFRYLHSTLYEKLCENYVYTFDFHDKTTLYLTFSVFQDQCDRGPALVQLRRQYLESGVDLYSDELPDYLPLVLEFAAIAPEKAAGKLLKLHFRAIRQLQLELQAIGSPYSDLLMACIETIESLKSEEKVS